MIDEIKAYRKMRMKRGRIDFFTKELIKMAMLQGVKIPDRIIKNILADEKAEKEEDESG